MSRRKVVRIMLAVVLLSMVPIASQITTLGNTTGMSQSTPEGFHGPKVFTVQPHFSYEGTTSSAIANRSDPDWYSVIFSGDIAAFDPHAYDSKGRHTGPVPNINPQSDLFTYETQIPNSTFRISGGSVYLTLDSKYDYR